MNAASSSLKRILFHPLSRKHLYYRDFSKKVLASLTTCTSTDTSSQQHQIQHRHQIQIQLNNSLGTISRNSPSFPTTRPKHHVVQKRYFDAARNMKVFPSYSVYGETSILNIKPIMPTFKTSGKEGNFISVDKKGRILFELSPITGNNINWGEMIKFALSVEELGLMISQLPFHQVRFVRQLNSMDGDGMNGSRYNTITNDESIEKTLTLTPSDGAAIMLELDYMKNGVGGQLPPMNTGESTTAPQHILLQAGEWEVIRAIVQDSIPSLAGWKLLMDVAAKDALTNRSS
mmetsp:Transcript_6705/g.7580  ORF Transcript_6705/g.7580 Transcript_6705/m.7580 type:complete len:289 (-) Transcript_6705:303-1169(-)